MEGTVVELLGGLDYVRAAHTHEFSKEKVTRSRRRHDDLDHAIRLLLDHAGHHDLSPHERADVDHHHEDQGEEE